AAGRVFLWVAWRLSRTTKRPYVKRCGDRFRNLTS
ncbi:unnamed protein product, partial [Ectocarpus sp. 13 AM-2016]